MKKKALIALALLLLCLIAWKLYASYARVSAMASFGYDAQGKFIFFSFSKPVFLEKIVIEEEEYSIKREAKQDYTLRYNWKPREEYTIRLVYSRGSSILRAKAPALESALQAEARFYRASFGEERVAVAEARVFSVENDVVKAYFSPGEEERVTILRYPPVFTSRDWYEEFIRLLVQELKKAWVKVRVESRLEKADGLLVVASGAWPEGLNRDNRTIYIGGPPGEVLIRRDGSLTLGKTWEGISASHSPVSSRLNFKNSAYTTSRYTRAVAYREDGMPGVFWLGNTLIFSNTLDRGWNSVEEAVGDVVEAVLTGGFGAAAKEEFKLKGNAANFTFIAYTRIQNASGWSLTLLSDNEGVRLTGKLLGGEAEIDAPASVYPGEEVEIRALIHTKSRNLRLEITGVRSKGRGMIEEASTKGIEARMIRAVFPESGLYLVKLLDGENVLGAALIRAKSMDVKATSVKLGANGAISLKILEDGKPYTGLAELIVNGERVLKAEVINGYLSYRGELPKDARVELLLHGKSYPISIVSGKGTLPAWVKTYHLVLVAILLLSALFSALVRKRESKAVTIDIPSVWRKEEIRAKASEVLKVFELYNRRMRWEAMPLTIEEVRKALHIFGVTKGYPDMRSLRRLLDREMSISVPLRERRVPDELCVASAYGYYAPYRWERDYQSVEHLAMIRACYDWLLSHGIEAKPLTLPSNRKGYPDILAVASSEVFNRIFEASHPEGEVVIYVECESGKKPSKEAKVKLVRAFHEKLRFLADNPLNTWEKNDKEEEFVVTKVLLLVLSEELYDAYKELLFNGEDEYQELVNEILELRSKKKLFIKNVKNLFQN